LPYGVKFRYKYINNFFHEDYTTEWLKGVLPPYHIMHSTRDEEDYLKIEDDEVKPYLFPLSSMTEEQMEELISKHLGYYQIFEGIGRRFFFEKGFEIYDWLNANHFDYRGLIEKGLAIDATDKNIY
jgi:hypothetical protein